ncbi:alkaline phosphatase family protein [Desulfurivibrio alkaliphilus]|uniref:Phosphonopyruvate decarboxylase-related protein n=1 Tax=Desulfurivibrio alkaliphilus (strain DSM 19089 / UNIQEM U267 / AHT2) TaxID=589865 RepID=D6Z1I3_DESAT|nr:alkaline phosphatase family protein [Desulfurivibrio alkaliphilus]ADH87317.1 phosphonopyruvate decarboxylase-related protein [Desulfurivibrio alkaliphilus AHT 2]
MARKCILIMLDGLGDRACPELGHRTPLQAATTPNLDRLATQGANGLYHAAALGQALPSENAHFAIFGYKPDDFPGRGCLETLGAGIELGPKQAAFLAHLVQLRVDSGGALVLEEDQPRTSPEEARQLLAAVAHYRHGEIDLHFQPTHGTSGVLVLSGPVSRFVTDTNTMAAGRPLPDLLPWREYADDPAAGQTAAALRSYLLRVHHTLAAHPVNQARREAGLGAVNGMVTQRGGQWQEVVDFRRHNGLRGLSIASGLVYWGLAAFLGLAVQADQDGDDPGDDLARRLTMAREALADFDFIHVHTKTPDQAAHRKDPAGKVRVIEALDRGLGRVLDDLLADPELVLVVMADHSTPSSGPLIHSGEPVPLLFAGPGVRRDRVNSFDELSVAGGALGLVRGTELMLLVLNYLDRAKLIGTREAPEDQPFWPGDYAPLRLDQPPPPNSPQESLK